MYHNELFGLRLRKIRNHHKETQKSLADFLGVKPNQIGEMENGRGATTLAKLARHPGDRTEWAAIKAAPTGTPGGPNV